MPTADLPGIGRQDPDVGAGHRVGDVLRQRGDALDLDRRAELDLVAGDGRAAVKPGDRGVDLELLEDPGERRDDLVVGLCSGRARRAFAQQRSRSGTTAGDTRRARPLRPTTEVALVRGGLPSPPSTPDRMGPRRAAAAAGGRRWEAGTIGIMGAKGRRHPSARTPRPCGAAGRGRGAADGVGASRPAAAPARGWSGRSPAASRRRAGCRRTLHRSHPAPGRPALAGLGSEVPGPGARGRGSPPVRRRRAGSCRRRPRLSWPGWSQCSRASAAGSRKTGRPSRA